MRRVFLVGHPLVLSVVECSEVVLYTVQVKWIRVCSLGCMQRASASSGGWVNPKACHAVYCVVIGAAHLLVSFILNLSVTYLHFRFCSFCDVI